MHLLIKRMERLVHDLCHQYDLTPEERFNAIKMALEAADWKVTPSELARIQKCVFDVEAEIRARRKKP
jgi:hypothetical protein